MPFLDARQEMAKEPCQAVPSWNSLSAALAVLSQGADGKIGYLKLMPWVKYDDPRLSLAIKRALLHHSH